MSVAMNSSRGGEGGQIFHWKNSWPLTEKTHLDALSVMFVCYALHRHYSSVMSPMHIQSLIPDGGGGGYYFLIFRSFFITNFVLFLLTEGDILKWTPLWLRPCAEDLKFCTISNFFYLAYWIFGGKYSEIQCRLLKMDWWRHDMTSPPTSHQTSPDLGLSPPPLSGDVRNGRPLKFLYNYKKDILY